MRFYMHFCQKKAEIIPISVLGFRLFAELLVFRLQRPGLLLKLRRFHLEPVQRLVKLLDLLVILFIVFNDLIQNASTSWQPYPLAQMVKSWLYIVFGSNLMFSMFDLLTCF